MSSDVLLIRPPRREFVDPFLRVYSLRTYPIGLAYLAAALDKGGVSVSVLDAWADPRMERVPLPSPLAYLKGLEDVRSVRSFAAYHHLGTPYPEIRSRLKEGRFPVVGISSMFSGYHLEALRVARLVKDASPESLVVMGGSAVTASPELTLEEPAVDYIVLGEGEEVFPRLVRRLLGREPGDAEDLPGVGRRRDGRFRIRPAGGFIPSLDDLPLPSYERVPPSLYRTLVKGRLEPHVTLFTSRGCPHKCDFCTIYITMGRRFRAQSPERVVEEMARCRRDHGVRLFNIEDDNFAFDQERAKAVLRLIIREFGERRMVLHNYNGMTALSLARDPELVGLMARAGFERVAIALESDDPEVRRVMLKPGTVPHFTRAVELCEKAGIRVNAFTIIGLPYSTRDKDVGAQLFCLTQPMTAVYPVLFYPIPTTAQYQDCLRKGWIRPEPRYLPRLRSTASAVRRPDYGRRETFTLRSLAEFFWEFKGMAEAHAGGRGRVPVSEVFRRHAAVHPLRAARRGPGWRLRRRSGSWQACDTVFFQAESLWKRGELLRRAEGGGGREALLRPVDGAATVIRDFRRGLPAHPLRYLSGREIFFPDAPSDGGGGQV